MDIYATNNIVPIFIKQKLQKRRKNRNPLLVEKVIDLSVHDQIDKTINKDISGFK